tara:strand:- start:3610 stop:4014 length:405 start_codon:yes stop_codon:yes gene_type:complete
LNKVKTKNQHLVASYGEAQIDNWLWENNWKCVYEPQIVIDDEEFLPDWVVWPQQGIDKPVIIEFWGLCRQDGKIAAWVIKKRDRYLYRKEIKESAYESCPHYYYIGVYPHQLDNLDAVLAEALQQIINSKTRQE